MKVKFPRFVSYTRQNGLEVRIPSSNRVAQFQLAPSVEDDTGILEEASFDEGAVYDTHDFEDGDGNSVRRFELGGDIAGEGGHIDTLFHTELLADETDPIVVPTCAFKG